MEDLYFINKKDFNTYLKGASKFGEQGVEGTVYKKSDLVIKDFGAKPKIDISHILQFRDLKIKDFSFPEAGIYIRQKLRACISKYAEGLSLSEKDIFLEEVNTVLKAVKHLEDTIKEASKEHIRMSDVNSGNVLFTGDHFNLIDSTFYYYSNLDYNDILKLNMMQVMKNVYTRLLPLKIYHFQFRNKGEYASYNFPHECLEELYYYLQNLLGQFQSFGEAEEMLKKQKISLP